jgi:hypothetical protein
MVTSISGRHRRRLSAHIPDACGIFMIVSANAESVGRFPSIAGAVTGHRAHFISYDHEHMLFCPGLRGRN